MASGKNEHSSTVESIIFHQFSSLYRLFMAAYRSEIALRHYNMQTHIVPTSGYTEYSQPLPINDSFKMCERIWKICDYVCIATLMKRKGVPFKDTATDKTQIKSYLPVRCTDIIYSICFVLCCLLVCMFLRLFVQLVHLPFFSIRFDSIRYS